MKLIVIFFILLPGFSCFAQKTSKEYRVEYQQFYDTKYPTVMPAVLYVKNDVTIYREIVADAQAWEGGTDQTRVRPTFARKNPVEDNYLRMDHSGKELLSFDVLPASKVLTTDYYPVMDWIMTPDTKDIAGHQCIKAITKYRGRDWEAWFAPDVALPYGPWKFHGLPGLILEAKSTDGKFLIKAVKIEEVSNDIFAVDFKTLRETINSKPITYQQYLADQDEYFENSVKKMESEGMTVILETPPRSGYELKYEWE